MCKIIMIDLFNVSVISNKLDGAMMSMIIKCVVLYFGDKGKWGPDTNKKKS